MTRIPVRIIAAIVGLLIVVGLIMAIPGCWQRIRSLTAQNKVNEAQSGAFHNSASDAVNTTGNVASNQAASEDLTRSNERTIRDAKGADQGVDPAVRDAGFASLCKRPSFRNNPANRLRCAAAR